MEIRDYNRIYHKDGDFGATYQPANEEIDGNTSYYLYTNERGNWIVMKRVLSGGTTSVITYSIGSYSDVDYTTAWTNRATLTYKAYSLWFTNP